MNFKEVGGGLYNRDKTFFNQRNHKVVSNFSVSLFILLTSALNLGHHYFADDKPRMHTLIIRSPSGDIIKPVC